MSSLAGKKMRLVALFILGICALNIYAQRTKKITASYTLYASEDMSIESAKLKALERAKIDAIEQAFGSHVSQMNATSIDKQNDNSEVSFSSYGGSEIRGEWIETTSEPSYDISYSDNILVVKVLVKGIIREIANSLNDVEIKILKNGIEPQFESTDFYDGDEMYMSLMSSSTGNLVVYLLDTKNNAYRLLPYRKQTEPSTKITDNNLKIFFNKKAVDAKLRRSVDEYVLTTNQLIELNTIFVVFTPNDLFKALDYQIDKGLPRELSSSDFHKWLATARRQDNQLIVKEIPITIRKRK